MCGRRRSRFKARTTQSSLVCLCVSVSVSVSVPVPAAVSVCVGGLAAAVKTFVRRVPLLRVVCRRQVTKRLPRKAQPNTEILFQLGNWSGNPPTSCRRARRLGCAQAQSETQAQSESESRAQTAGAALALSLRESHAKLMRVFSSCLLYLNVYSVTLTHTQAHCSVRFVSELSVNWLLEPNGTRGTRLVCAI